MFGGETFKNFTINFNALNTSVTFSSGDVLSGQIKFELSKEAKVQSLTMTLQGKAKVLWTTRRRTGGGRRGRSRTQTVTHSARLDFFSLKTIVVQANNAIGHTALQPGTHVYPFTCLIPQGNFPSTFQGAHGKVSYSLTFAIHRPWHLAKEFETEFKFVNHIDANHPQLLAPLAASNSKTAGCLWCTSGPISMNVHLERKGFVPGEMVKITAQIGNASSRTVTPKATLTQTQTFYTQGKRSKKVVPKLLARVDGQTVNPNSSDVYCEMMVQIPNDAALTISNCQILEVEYSLMVSLRISGGASSLETLFPIILCSIPVHQRGAYQPTACQPSAPQPNAPQPPAYQPPAYQPPGTAY